MKSPILFLSERFFLRLEIDADDFGGLFYTDGVSVDCDIGQNAKKSQKNAKKVLNESQSY